MIRVHVLMALYPEGDGSTHRRTPLGVDLSLVPERIDVLQGITVPFREAFKLPKGTRCVLRYECPGHGYRLYALSDTRDSVERAYTAYRHEVLTGTKPSTELPDYIPENL